MKLNKHLLLDISDDAYPEKFHRFCEVLEMQIELATTISDQVMNPVKR